MMIQVNDLRFTYPGSATPAIRGIGFSSEKGEIFGFLGLSGSGKSTTQKILFKLLNPYQGSALIEGREVREWGKDLYLKIGVGFELPNHYLKLTALENLEFFRAFYPVSTDPMELLAMVGLEKDARRKVADFSKGMKMRLNFVRALLHDPDILFFDEPTSGLDPVNARVLKDMILQLKARGKTIFITTHQMHDAEELCDRVAFIVEGQIMAMDTPQSLKVKHSQRSVELRLKGDRQLHRFSLDQLGQNREFLELINASEVETIHSREAGLDEIFIELTGKNLV